MAQDLALFYPEVWVPRTLDVLASKLVMANRVLVVPLGGVNSPGDTANMQLPGSFTAQNKSINVSVLIQTASVTNVAVVLNAHKEVTFVINDAEAVKSAAQLDKAYLEPAAIAVANTIEDALLAEYVNLTITDVGTYGTDISASLYPAIRKALRTANSPEPWTMIVSAKDEENLLTMDTAGTNFFIGGGRLSGGNMQTEMENGQLGRRLGIDTFVSNRIPVTDVTTDQTHNIAFGAQTFALASAELPMAPSGVYGVNQFAIERDGFRLRGTMSYDTNLLGVKITVDALYGVKTVRPATGLEVRS